MQSMWLRQREQARDQLQRRLQLRRDRQMLRQQMELERIIHDGDERDSHDAAAGTSEQQETEDHGL